MKKIFLAVILVFLILSNLSSAQAAEPVKIAAIFAKTGLASTSSDEFDMVHLAVNDINSRGGVLSRQIEVIEFDNKSTAVGSREAALEAVKQNVVAVIGATWSSHCLAMAPVLQEAGIPMITPSASNPEVTRIGNYIFRACFTDPFQGKIMATFAVTDLKAKTAAILVNAGNDYSLSLARFFRQTAQSLGLAIALEEPYSGQQVDFANVLDKIKTIQPDVIFVPGYLMDSALIIKQGKKMGIRGIFLGGDGWSELMLQYTDSATLEGGYYLSHWYKGVDLFKSSQLPDQFFKAYKKEMSIYLPLWYDSVLLIVNAIQEAGSLDRRIIRDKLAATKNFEVNTGIITFDENRDPLNKDAVIVKFEHGQPRFVKSIRPK